MSALVALLKEPSFGDQKFWSVGKEDGKKSPRVLRDLDHKRRMPKLEPPPNRSESEVESRAEPIAEPPSADAKAKTPPSELPGEEDIEELVPDYMRREYYRSQELDAVPASIELGPKGEPIVEEPPPQPEVAAEPEAPVEEDTKATPWGSWAALLLAMVAIFFLADYLASPPQQNDDFQEMTLREVSPATPTPVPTFTPEVSDLPPPVSDPEPAIPVEPVVEEPPTPPPATDVPEPEPRRYVPPPAPRRVPPISSSPAPPRPPIEEPSQPWTVSQKVETPAPEPAPDLSGPPVEYVLPEPEL